MSHEQKIYTKPPSKSVFSSIITEVSGKNSNEFKNRQQTYHPDRSLNTSISCTIIPHKNTETVMKHVFHYGYLYMNHLKRFS